MQLTQNLHPVLFYSRLQTCFDTLFELILHQLTGKMQFFNTNDVSFFSGEWIVFLSGSRHEAPGADREQRSRTTEPSTQGEHRVPVCRPHAPPGVPAPL